MQLLLGLPAAIIFGPIFWVMIFLQTYRHFPRMKPRKRILYAVTSATAMMAFLLVVVLVAFYLIASFLGS